jgi:hypothetical protein
MVSMLLLCCSSPLLLVSGTLQRGKIKSSKQSINQSTNQSTYHQSVLFMKRHCKAEF